MRELGERLKQRRLDRGITLDDVQAATKIRLRYLTALEEGRFDVIPGEVYLKGFLRTYADYLGLDGLDMLREYQHIRERRYREAMLAEQEQADEEDGRSTRAPGAAPAPERSAAEAGAGPEGPIGGAPGAGDSAPLPSYRPLRTVQRDGRSHRWMLPAAIVGLVLILLAVIAVWMTGSGERAVTVADVGGSRAGAVQADRDGRSNAGDAGGESEAQDRVETSAAELTERAASAPFGRAEEPSGSGAVAQANERVRAESVRLEVFAHEACWLRVFVDGEPVYEGTMIPGERRIWEAGDRLRIRLGNATGVDLTVNGHELEKPTRDVIEREFTAAAVAELYGGP